MVCLLLFLIGAIIIGTNYLTIIFRYVSEGKSYLARWETTCSYEGLVNNCSINNIFDLSRVYLLGLSSIYGFDYYAAHGTSIFCFLVPLISVISGFYFINFYNSTFQFHLYRKENCKKYLLYIVLKEAFYISVSVFFAYMSFYLFAYLITKGGTAEIGAFKYFLSDLFGENFFVDHLYAYYFVEGLIRFFFVPFTYSLFGQCLSLFVDSRKIMLVPIIFYYGITIIATLLYEIIPISIYFNPLMIMANQSIINYNSIGIMMFTFVLLIVCLFFVSRKGDKLEI